MKWVGTNYPDSYRDTNMRPEVSGYEKANFYE
jgi:hypothetical protein